ncbi:MAG TPA: hypothetical protein VFV74_11105 [Burkholderiales bacterium]|nr:hypothetical protein [Burkholderiales bacterium]
MPAMLMRRALCVAAIAMSAPAYAQSGLRLPRGDEPGLDPTFASGWWAPQYDRFGFASDPGRDRPGFAPGTRLDWSYDLSARARLGMSYAGASELDSPPRPLALFGRYWLSTQWALSAESASRDAPGLLRLQDVRIGVQRRF